MWPGKKHKYETHFLTSLFVSFFVYLVVLAIPYAGHSSETNGEVRRGWLGVKAQDLNPDLAAIFELKEPTGVFITVVVKGSPAAEAGLMAKDVILEFNRKPVYGWDKFRDLVAWSVPGSDVLLKVWRNGASIYVSAILGECCPPPMEDEPQATPEKPKSKETFQKKPKPASAPTIELHQIDIKPSPVPAGQKFALDVKYTVTDPFVKDEQVPVQFSFTISSNT